MTLETLEQVLPGAEMYIMNDEGSTLKYFPIRPLEKEQPKESNDEGGTMNNG